MSRRDERVAKPWHAFLLAYVAFAAGMRLVEQNWLWFWFWLLAGGALVEAALIADDLRRES